MVPNRELGRGTQLRTLGEVLAYLGNLNHAQKINRNYL